MERLLRIMLFFAAFSMFPISAYAVDAPDGRPDAAMKTYIILFT